VNVSRTAGSGPRSRLSAWIHHHRQAASDSLNKLLAAPLSTALTLLVVGITLALPAALLIVLSNARDIAAHIEVPSRLSVFLENDVDVTGAMAISEALTARLDIAAVAFIDRDTALLQFSQDTGLNSLVESLHTNPLPHTLLITPDASLSNERLQELADSLGNTDGIGEVVFDTQWLGRLQASLVLVQRLVMGLGAMMAIGAVLILGNTIRLAIEARRAEIVVIKLIGGGDAFARRPFLYSGLWSGIGGGVLAVVLVLIFMWLLAEPAQELIRLYDGDHILHGLSLVSTLRLILTGGALGLLSAWQATALHLKDLEPR